jgi:hypothetical protein
VSTCDAWAPHVIYFTSAIRCNILVFILGGFKHDDDDDHHKIGRMAMEVTVEPWRCSPLWCKRPYYSQYNMIICVWCLFSCHTILSCLLCGQYAFNHDRIASLIKVENFDILFQKLHLLKFWSLCGRFTKVEYHQLSSWIGWVSDINLHSIGLLNKAIKMVLGFRIWSWSRGIGCHPTNKSHIEIWLATCCLPMSLTF